MRGGRGRMSSFRHFCCPVLQISQQGVFPVLCLEGHSNKKSKFMGSDCLASALPLLYKMV